MFSMLNGPWLTGLHVSYYRYLCGNLSMRTNTDICLHCRINPATKTNSHILPRFISTNFLGPKGMPRRGYDLNSEDYEAKRTKIIQDSPKENYILCEECEQYFSVLEGLSADVFKNWQSKVDAGEFAERKIEEYLSIVECTTANPRILRLLVYSMFWRASISSHHLFENYKLSSPLEESLRESLLLMKSLTPAQLEERLKNLTFSFHPYSCITARSFEDESANVLAAINPGNPASLHVDRYGFLLFERKEDVKDPVFSRFGNNNENDLRILILAEQLWHELMVERPIKMVVEEVIAKRKA